jgi:hypothetical protein
MTAMLQALLVCSANRREDGGFGVPAPAVERIFERFGRA